MHAYMYLYMCIYLYTYICKIQMMFVELSEKALKAVQKNLSHSQAWNNQLSFVTLNPQVHP